VDTLKVRDAKDVEQAVRAAIASDQPLEIIGHGSGTYDTSKYGPTEDPVSALGEWAMAHQAEIEDARARFDGRNKPG